MTHAIVETGGKQYMVKEGDVIYIEKLPAGEDGKIVFENVLAVIDGENRHIGTPYVKGAAVEASFIKDGKSRKVIVYKMHPKKGYRRKQGHRQPYTKAQIDKISVE